MRRQTIPSFFSTIFLCFLFVSGFLATAQNVHNSAIAKTGDGIFSILRKSGIQPIKYYEEFLNLNKENIKNGSELIIGKEYLLPHAPDSFKNTGTRIVVGEDLEMPIFNETQLTLMNLKDTTLQNTVYYFVHSGGVASKKRFDGLMSKLARDLMIKGARVYILEDDVHEDNSISDTIKSIDKKTLYGNYSSRINRKYLMHHGSYQRVILLEDNYSVHKNLALAIGHNEHSKEGYRLAHSFGEILRKNSSTKVKNDLHPFKEETSLYFANNLVPPLIILNFIEGSDKVKNGFYLKSEKKPLVSLLNDGILEDYSQLNFDN